MRNLLLITLLFFSVSAWAGLESPIPSDADGFTIPNSHDLLSSSEDFRIVRGMAPRSESDYEELLDNKMSRVMIFKNPGRSAKEVEQEIEVLKEMGFKAKDIKHINFPWRQSEENPHSFRDLCKMTIDGMRFLEDSYKSQKNTFFHCTVGEDRTGFLAGLYQIYYNNWSVKDAFYFEMCENGYASGNPQKPFNKVVLKVRDLVTPLFLKMAFLLERTGRLDKRICNDPLFSRRYSKKFKSEYWKEKKYYLCPPSTKFPH